MRGVCLVLVILAIACEAFGYWGLNTVAGRHTFDEMAGMVPLAAVVAGVFFAACAPIAWWRSTLRRRPPVSSVR